MSEWNSIITIGREFGAGGRSIAKKISEELGIPYYDKDIIKITAEQTGISEDMLRDTEDSETKRNLFNWLLSSTDLSSSYDRTIMVQAEMIRILAKKGPCIIVGRGADYILRDFPNVVNVFVHAEMEDKVKYAMETYGEDRDHATRRVRHIDAARESYYHYLTGGRWGYLSNYDLTLNSSTIGKENCAEIIMAFAAKKQQK